MCHRQVFVLRIQFSKTCQIFSKNMKWHALRSCLFFLSPFHSFRHFLYLCFLNFVTYLNTQSCHVRVIIQAKTAKFIKATSNIQLLPWDIFRRIKFPKKLTTKYSTKQKKFNVNL